MPAAPMLVLMSRGSLGGLTSVRRIKCRDYLLPSEFLFYLRGKMAIGAAVPSGARGIVAGLQRLRPGLHVEAQPLTSNGCSWVVLARGFAPSSHEEFESLWKHRPTAQPRGTIMGKQVLFPRHSQAYGFDYAFTGQVASALPLSQAPSIISRSHNEVNAIESCAETNSVLANWYDASSKHYIGAHSDNEAALRRGEPICSLSLCSPHSHSRRFRFVWAPSKRWLSSSNGVSAFSPLGWRDEPGGADGVVLHLRDGDLLVMGGDCQSTHKHEILRPGRSADEKTGRRVNLTFRVFRDERNEKKVESPFRFGRSQVGGSRVGSPVGRPRVGGSQAGVARAGESLGGELQVELEESQLEGSRSRVSGIGDQILTDDSGRKAGQDGIQSPPSGGVKRARVESRFFSQLGEGAPSSLQH